jgi:small-conductance mechanosensitive channel
MPSGADFPAETAQQQGIAHMDDQLELLDHIARTSVDLAINFGPKVLVAILILAAGFYAGRWAGRMIDGLLAKPELDWTVRQLLVRIVRILVLAHDDRSRVVIPDRKIVGEVLHNFGSIRQLAVTVGVAYSTDVNKALSAIDEVLRSNAHVLQDPAPVRYFGFLPSFG